MLGFVLHMESFVSGLRIYQLYTEPEEETLISPVVQVNTVSA